MSTFKNIDVLQTHKNQISKAVTRRKAFFIIQNMLEEWAEPPIPKDNAQSPAITKFISQKKIAPNKRNG